VEKHLVIITFVFVVYKVVPNRPDLCTSTGLPQLHTKKLKFLLFSEKLSFTVSCAVFFVPGYCTRYE
jgi:hypothetical protein